MRGHTLSIKLFGKIKSNIFNDHKCHYKQKPIRLSDFDHLFSYLKLKKKKLNSNHIKL